MFRKILAANDGSDNAFKALAVAADMARRYRAELHVVLVEEIIPISGAIAEVREVKRQEDQLVSKHRRRIKAIAAHHDQEAALHTFAGHPVRTIVEFARDNSFDLLVIGATGHSDFYERLLGSRAGHIVHLASCTVMVVK